MQKKKIYLIDGSAYIYRAYHAVAPLTNSAGIPTNATFGFINMVRRMMKEKEPDYMCVAFDSKGKVFRHTMYPEYKANRPPMPEDLRPQIEYIKSAVKGYNLCLLEEEEYEADDIIASLAVTFSNSGYEIVIVSGDKDLLQLVSDTVVMWDPMKNVIYDPESVEQKYGIPVEKLLDYFALVGDSSDNVPGVPGVGPKTATKLISEYGSLEGLYENVAGMKKSKMKERLIDNKDAAYLSRDLIRLYEDVTVDNDVETYKVVDVDTDKLTGLFKELEFTSFLQEVHVAKKVDTDGFRCLRSRHDLEKIIDTLLTASEVVFDTETTSLNPRAAELVGISLCINDQESWYLPLGHREEDGEYIEDQISQEDVKELLGPVFLSEKIAKLGHNLKYDYSVLQQTLGITLKGELCDTMIASYLLDPGRRSHKLDDLCLELDLQLTSFTDVVGGDKRDEAFAYVEVEKASDYSCEDVYGCFLLWKKYEKLLKENDLYGLFANIEMKVMPILAEMERRGVCLDRRILNELHEEFNLKISALETAIHDLAGESFNLNSPKQLGGILFEKLGLPYGRKTKTGYSTDVKVLEKLAVKHDLPAKILEYRTLAKLQSTYVEKLGELIDDKTGRVYTSFNQTVTATGRLSSTNPNLQNIPIRTEDGNRIREAFVPDSHCVFLSADYSQIDLRVLAHYSQDEALLNAFREGKDIHDTTAREIFSNPLFITPEMRRVAKSINFGIVYGMSSFGLSNQLGLSRKDAQTFIDRYFSHYKGVKQFMEQIIEQAREDGFVTTLCKRRRLLPEIHAKNKNVREFAERIALNTPIQGTAADIIKLAMIRVEKILAEHNLRAKLLMQIHDELVFELPEEELEETTVHVKNAMETALQLDVPLSVNLEVGNSLSKK